MRLKLYAYRDSKIETFTDPFLQHTPGEAERTFRDTVSNPKSKLNQHPEDFSLYYLGEYETNTGIITPLKAPEHIMQAIQVEPKRATRGPEQALPF